MFLGPGMARGAAGRSNRRMGLLQEGLHSILMALTAGLGVLCRLLAGLRGHQESGDEDGQPKEPERL